jgi:hypothetical protein
MSVLCEIGRTDKRPAPVTPVHSAAIENPSAWKVADLASPADYTVDLTPAHLHEIEDAMQKIKAAGLGLGDLTREHFPFPSLKPVIDKIGCEIADGRGFVVVRRLPVEDYSKEELGMIFWGLGTHLGRGLSQSVLGERLGHVKDFSRDDPLARAFDLGQLIRELQELAIVPLRDIQHPARLSHLPPALERAELSPHTDSADLVGLICLRNASAGGVSRLTSATAVHNVMREECPDYLETLYCGYVHHRRGEEQPGELPYTPYRVPVFSNIDGQVSARYVRSYIEAGEAAVGRPMDEDGRAVLDHFEAITKRPELMLEFTLQSGAMYFVNNYTILHARTAFDDGDAPDDERRHLLRLWLEVPGMRPVHPYVRGRGVVAVPGRTPSFDWAALTKNSS